MIKEKIKGGIADNKSISDIAKHYNVSVEKIEQQIKIGLKVEKEHTNDEEKALEIVKDHLMEMLDYYTKLKEIEKSVEILRIAFNEDKITEEQYLDAIKKAKHYEKVKKTSKKTGKEFFANQLVGSNVNEEVTFKNLSQDKIYEITSYFGGETKRLVKFIGFEEESRSVYAKQYSDSDKKVSVANFKYVDEQGQFVNDNARDFLISKYKFKDTTIKVHSTEMKKPSELQQHLKTLTDMTSGKQKDYYEWQHKNSKSVEISAIDSFPKYTKELLHNQESQIKQCYRNAALVAISVPEAKYVEGYVSLHGIPIEHAWNKIGDKYVDITAEKALGGKADFKEYLSVLDLDGEKTMQLMHKTGEYGSWTGRVFMEDNKFEKSYVPYVSELFCELTKGYPEQIFKSSNELEYVKEYADCIVINTEGKLLMLYRGNQTNFEPNKWGLPGGHIDDGETAETAAMRELIEETNLEPYSVELLDSIDNGDQSRSLYFVCKVKSTDSIILENNEHYNYQWVNSSQLEKLDTILNLKDRLLNILLINTDFGTVIVNPFEPTIIEREAHVDVNLNMLQMENKYDAAFTIIKAAFDKGQITEEQYYKAREKYADISKGKKAEVGETRTWGKIKMQKTASGWVPVSEGKKGKEGEDDKEKTETEKPETETTDIDDEKLMEHAKNASETDLKKTITNSKDEKLRVAAKKELKRRTELHNEIEGTKKENDDPDAWAKVDENKNEETKTEVPIEDTHHSELVSPELHDNVTKLVSDIDANNSKNPKIKHESILKVLDNLHSENPDYEAASKLLQDFAANDKGKTIKLESINDTVDKLKDTLQHTKEQKFKKGHEVRYNDSSAGFHRTQKGNIVDTDSDGKYHTIKDSVGNHKYISTNDITHHDDGTGMKETGNKIKKSEENDIEKGGEGSRGGKVIGHTKTGKAIYDTDGHSKHEYEDLHHNVPEIHRKDMQSRKNWSDSIKEHEDHIAAGKGKLSKMSYKDKKEYDKQMTIKLEKRRADFDEHKKELFEHIKNNPTKQSKLEKEYLRDEKNRKLDGYSGASEESLKRGREIVTAERRLGKTFDHMVDAHDDGGYSPLNPYTKFPRKEFEEWKTKK